MRQIPWLNGFAPYPNLDRYPDHYPKSYPLKILFLIWAAAFLPALVAFGDETTVNYFVYSLVLYFPKMIVHEFGHFCFFTASGIPSVPFFFATFPLTSAPMLSFVLLLLILEGLTAWHLTRRGYILLPCLAVTLIFSQLFFVLFPQFSSPFAIFGGVAGQFAVPVIFLLVAVEIPRLRTVKGCIAFAFLSTVFWGSLIQWTLAVLGYRPIPYPRDGSGRGMNLFQDPFTAPGAGAPQGDMDQLILLYGWTERSLVHWYVILGAVLLLTFVIVWRWAFLYGFWIQADESVELSGTTPVPALHQSKTPALPQPHRHLDSK